MNVSLIWRPLCEEFLLLQELISGKLVCSRTSVRNEDDVKFSAGPVVSIKVAWNNILFALHCATLGITTQFCHWIWMLDLTTKIAAVVFTVGLPK